MASGSGYGGDGEFPNSPYSNFNFSLSRINSLVRELEGDGGNIPIPSQHSQGPHAYSGQSSSSMPPPPPRFPAENIGGITSNF